MQEKKFRWPKQNFEEPPPLKSTGGLLSNSSQAWRNSCRRCSIGVGIDTPVRALVWSWWNLPRRLTGLALQTALEWELGSPHSIVYNTIVVAFPRIVSGSLSRWRPPYRGGDEGGVGVSAKCSLRLSRGPRGSPSWSSLVSMTKPTVASFRKYSTRLGARVKRAVPGYHQYRLDPRYRSSGSRRSDDSLYPIELLLLIQYPPSGRGYVSLGGKAFVWTFLGAFTLHVSGDVQPT